LAYILKEVIINFVNILREIQKKKRTTYSRNNPNQNWTRMLFEYEKWFSSPNSHPMSQIRQQPTSKFRLHFINFEGWKIII